METLQLAIQGWELTLLPALGGRIAACRWRHPDGKWLDIIKPLSKPYDGEEEAGCFPLTPFSNRLRDRTFTFEGRTVSMPRNTPGPHVEHGHGWQRAWNGEAIDGSHAVLRYDHAPDAWPYAYSIRQDFTLAAEALTVTLHVQNRDSQPMPFGFGLHPFFPADDGTTLEAALAGVWEVDDEVMPTRLAPAARPWGAAPELRVAHSPLDNVFTGWDGVAMIRWPERNAGLRMTADLPLRHLVVYSPVGAGHFCAEPVSHSTDAFNLAATIDGTGLLVLPPDGQASASIVLTPFAIG